MAVENGTVGSTESSDMYANSKEIVDLLVSLGVESNTAKTLICLHLNGPSKSTEIQSNCNLRQPDVSIAISKLSNLGILRIVTSPSKARGRPSSIYELAVPLNEAILPFKNKAWERMSIIENQLSRLSELTNSA
ncbi:MAG: ArsR family transcriptional regulator [Euryarchaeota archaeon]|nr:ArsR family transcriptional regulator [Euryarchaeota archaeon]MAS57070.1 ArsR family transcriptional regulator [Euryarchaeota archaeon]|tara:strand:+ start:358 stop:759 length:402 start_codon:yes stop_codon:yes gene_type:complete